MQQEAVIINLFKKPVNKERFDKDEAALVLSNQQKYCDHSIEIDEDTDEHNCKDCGKRFSSHEALLYVLENRNKQVKLSSYNLRNEIHFLTIKAEELKDDIKALRAEKRKLNKL